MNNSVILFLFARVNIPISPLHEIQQESTARSNPPPHGDKDSSENQARDESTLLETSHHPSRRETGGAFRSTIGRIRSAPTPIRSRSSGLGVKVERKVIDNWFGPFILAGK